MRVAVVTAGSPDYEELSAVTSPSKVRYAQKHGYDFFKFQVTKETGDLCKYQAYCQLAKEGKHDIFFWIDMDALIMNSEVKVEELVTLEMGKRNHFMWGYDHAGPNSGVYLCRFTPEGRHFMDRSYATMRENGLADETAMEMTMLTPPFGEWVRVVPGRLLNAYDYDFYWGGKYGLDHERSINRYDPGCFILHMPGYSNYVRIPELKKRAEEAT